MRITLKRLRTLIREAVGSYEALTFDQVLGMIPNAAKKAKPLGITIFYLTEPSPESHAILYVDQEPRDLIGQGKGLIVPTFLWDPDLEEWNQLQ